MKNRGLSALLVLLIIALICSCKRESDYRDKYLGVYTFTVHQHFIKYNDSIVFDTIVYYSGKIDKDQSNSDIIKINYDTWGNISPTITSTGKLYSNLNWPLGMTLSGQFESPYKLTFKVYYYPDYLSNYEVVQGIKN